MSDNQRPPGAPTPRPPAQPPSGSRGGKKRSGPKSKTSPFVGVTQYKRTGNWEAHIWIQGSQKAKGFQRHLGSYETAEDAARCYDRAALKLRGDVAELNFPKEEYAQDAFLTEHVRTDKLRFLDLLRQKYSIQVTPRPAAPVTQARARRAPAAGSKRRYEEEDGEEEEEEEEEDGQQPSSPRTRTVHRVPRDLPPAAGPQRVTVHQPPPALRLLPRGGGAVGSGLGETPGSSPSPSASPLAAGAGFGAAFPRFPGSAGLHHASLGQQAQQQYQQAQRAQQQYQQAQQAQQLGGDGAAAARAKGLLLREPSNATAVSEELLISTAPMGQHLHEIGWPYATALAPAAPLSFGHLGAPLGAPASGPPAGSGGTTPTPCSSPTASRFLWLPELQQQQQQQQQALPPSQPTLPQPQEQQQQQQMRMPQQQPWRGSSNSEAALHAALLHGAAGLSLPDRSAALDPLAGMPGGHSLSPGLSASTLGDGGSAYNSLLPFGLSSLGLLHSVGLQGQPDRTSGAHAGIGGGIPAKLAGSGNPLTPTAPPPSPHFAPGATHAGGAGVAGDLPLSQHDWLAPIAPLAETGGGSLMWPPTMHFP